MVLITDAGLPRYRWPIGVVNSLCPSDDGIVRKVYVKMSSPRTELGRPTGGKVAELLRPVVKLIPIVRVTDK